MKMIFFWNILSNSPAFAIWNSLTNQFYQKKIMVSGNFQNWSKLQFFQGPCSTFQIFKLLKLCYHFFYSFKNKNYFLKYPLLSPALCRPEFIDQSILQKKFRCLEIFNKKPSKKFFQDPSLHFSFLNRPNFVTIFCRVLKMRMIFILNIPSYPLPFTVWNLLNN